VLDALFSRFGKETLPLICRLVMPPRSFRISSTRCMPSVGLGFFGRMYRSRCRPKLDAVKAWPQKGQFLSFAALSCAGSAVEWGVVLSEASPMAAVETSSSSVSKRRAVSSFMHCVGLHSYRITPQNADRAKGE
jgi:hypothetical protein